MKTPSHRAPPTVASADIPDEWIATLRDIASRREGQQLRPHPTLPMIQSKDVNTGVWCNQMLYGSAMAFMSFEERDIFWKRVYP